MGRIADALKRAEEERLNTVTGVPHAPYDPVVSIPKLPKSRPIGSPIELESEFELGQNLIEKPKTIVDGISDSLVPFFEQSSVVTEQYRSLRTRLLSQNPRHEHKVLAVTSAIPKEGKSVTTLNLGCVLAEIRQLKILIVDCDFRRSTLARMLNQESSPGLIDVLRGEATFEEVIRPTPIPNLSLIPAGHLKGQSPAELLAGASASPAFRKMQNGFHYTLVDTPPATTVTDVGIVGQMCSGVIVLVRLHRTAEVAARRTVQLLQSNNIPIVGCVIIGRDAPAGRYGYGYGYEYGYSYNYYRYYDYYNKKQQGNE